MDLLHALTLADVLREHRRSLPERVAAVDGDVRLTFPELDDRVSRLANALLAEGVEAGDRVLWLGQNSFRVLEALLAAAKVGAVFCPANWRQSPEELAFVIDDADAKVVIWQAGEVGETVEAGRAASGSKGLWLCHDAEGEGSYEAFLAGGEEGDPDVWVDPASAVLMLYTAAFEGRPNGALLSHTGILAQDLALALTQRIDADWTYLNSGPLFHIATFMNTLATFHMGGKNVFTPRVDAEELCRLVEAERCNGAFIMPPTVKQVVELNAGGRYDLSSLRVGPGVATSNPAWAAMVTVGDSPWLARPAGYGQTEVVGMLTYNAFARGAQGTFGRPSPWAQVRVLGPDGAELPPGEVGELAARGPTVMVGYHNRPELNAARQAGGWHHTGDLARREADGSISFIGPMTRIVKSAAENIYPAEVEACIAAHPAVKECAVIGVPDPVWGQNVKAVVVLKDGEAATADDIVEHCRERIASYKKPKLVEFAEALPRTGAGPVDYDALDARYGGGGYPGSGA